MGGVEGELLPGLVAGGDDLDDERGGVQPDADTIDACIAIGVRRRGDALATTDPGDMRLLLGSGFTILAV